MKMENFNTIYNEFLEEMCEDLAIDVNNADEDLKAIARNLANEYIAENQNNKCLRGTN
jgi:hypothetical protein